MFASCFKSVERISLQLQDAGANRLCAVPYMQLLSPPPLLHVLLRTV